MIFSKIIFFDFSYRISVSVALPSSKRVRLRNTGGYIERHSAHESDEQINSPSFPPAYGLAPPARSARTHAMEGGL
jgi:hypothetical protein